MTAKKKTERDETKGGSTRSLRGEVEKQLARTPRASKKRSSDLKGQTEKALKERIKELNCFFGISAVMELQNIKLDEILEKIVLLLPPRLAVSRDYRSLYCTGRKGLPNGTLPENLLDARP